MGVDPSRTYRVAFARRPGQITVSVAESFPVRQNTSSLLRVSGESDGKPVIIIYVAVGVGGLSAAAWRIAYVVALRLTARDYLKLCDRALDHPGTQAIDVLAHAERALGPPLPTGRSRGAAASR
jgi:hypothetical protein